MIFWLLFFVVISGLDAARDCLVGRVDYWTWHLIKWGAFYPPLAIILWVHVKRRFW